MRNVFGRAVRLTLPGILRKVMRPESSNGHDLDLDFDRDHTSLFGMPHRCIPSNAYIGVGNNAMSALEDIHRVPHNRGYLYD